MNRRQFAISAVAACAASGVPAALASIDKRSELAGMLGEYRLLGSARLSVYGLKVYDSRLWVSPGFNSEGFASQPFALELDYLRDFKNEAIVDRSLAEMRRVGAVSDEQTSQWRAAMLRVIPNVKKGDRIMGVNRPGKGAAFWVNGKLAGDVADAEFAGLFFGIWLSPKTSQPKMRASLLAVAN